MVGVGVVNKAISHHLNSNCNHGNWVYYICIRGVSGAAEHERSVE